MTARTILLWIVIALSSGLSAVAGWYWSISGAQQVTHTVQVQKLLGDVFSAALNLETGHRGLLLTGDRSYLAPYNDSKIRIFELVSELQRLVADNAEQTERIASMRPLLDERVAVIESSLALFNQGKLTEAADIVRSGRGKNVMDQLRVKIEDARKSEETLFLQRDEAFQNQRMLLLMALVGLLLASIVLATVSIARERERRETVEAAARLLTTSNEELEKRVASRTADLEIERNRAEALLRDVTHRIGNTLALVVGFINLHIRHATDPQSIEILSGARQRIHAIASAQRRMNVTNDLELVRIDSLIESVLSDVSAATLTETEIVVDIPPLLAAAQFATSLCVLTQEFVMNSVKHAFPGGRKGQIKISLQQMPERGGILEIADNGKGMTIDATDDGRESGADLGGGLGAKIATLLTKQFGGTITYQSAENGTDWPGTKVRIALPELDLVQPSADTVAA